jgi:hypothetical protein
MGTALGLALTGLVYDFAASPREGFLFATVFLASVSAAAVVVAASRGGYHSGEEPVTYAE